MNSLEAKRAIIEKMNEVVELARRLYPTYTHAAPVVRFDIRGRSCGGMAIGHHTVRFNLDWYAANPSDYLKNTVPHEVAHIVATATGLGRGHNRGWVRICLALGGDGKRCNTNAEIREVPKARRTREYLYMTSRGSEIWVGPVHHKRLQTRGAVIHPVTNKPCYYLRVKNGGSIMKDGFQGRSRLKA